MANNKGFIFIIDTFATAKRNYGMRQNAYSLFNRPTHDANPYPDQKISTTKQGENFYLRYGIVSSHFLVV